MPTFEFECSKHHRFDYFKRTLGPPNAPNCPTCGEKTTLLIGGDQVIGRVNGNPTTVGQQAEINARKLGKEQVQKLSEESKSKAKKGMSKLPPGASRIKTEAKTPWWRTDKKPLDMSKLNTPKKIEKYIYTGKK